MILACYVSIVHLKPFITFLFAGDPLCSKACRSTQSLRNKTSAHVSHQPNSNLFNNSFPWIYLIIWTTFFRWKVHYRFHDEKTNVSISVPCMSVSALRWPAAERGNELKRDQSVTRFYYRRFMSPARKNSSYLHLKTFTYFMWSRRNVTPWFWHLWVQVNAPHLEEQRQDLLLNQNLFRPNLVILVQTEFRGGSSWSHQFYLSKVWWSEPSTDHFISMLHAIH